MPNGLPPFWRSRGGIQIPLDNSDVMSHGGDTSAQRWLNNRSMETIDVTGMNVANGARDDFSIINPQLVTTDPITGRQTTPRSNVHGAFGRTGFWGGGGRTAAEIMAAAALGSYGIGAAFGGEGVVGAGTLETAGTAGSVGGTDLTLLAPIADGSSSLPAMVAAPEIVAPGAAVGGAGGTGATTGGSDFSGASSTASGSSGTSGNSLLDSLRSINRGRSIFNLGRSLLGQSGGRMPTNAGGTSDISSMLMQILGIGSIGHSAFGGGLGTASGAVDAGNRAAAVADPWGSSGRRQQFNDILSPQYVMGLINPDPNQVFSNPLYQNLAAQGRMATQVGQGANGTRNSGAGAELRATNAEDVAARYYDTTFGQNMQRLGALGTMAGVGASSPAGAAASMMSGYGAGANLRNDGMSNLLGSVMSGMGNPLAGLFSQGASGIGQLFNSLFGGDSGSYSINDYGVPMSGPGAADDSLGSIWGSSAPSDVATSSGDFLGDMGISF